ncbi:hypothetical protein [Azorhizobium oxalatiphilum]|nr:hypothetical protein [Azorhizobium oxalatiphilum]
MAPAICRTLREIVGADAASVFWLDHESKPAGVFHESASDSALDLFVNEYERLFMGPGEINVSQIAGTPGRPIGRLLNPQPEYLRSNTLNLLVRPSGHYHALDMRVDVEGRPRAVVLLFREERRPFGDSDAFKLAQAIPYLRRAIETSGPDDGWEGSGLRGHLLVDRAGERLLMLDQQGHVLLRACTLVGQDIRIASAPTHPPRFARVLCERLETSAVAHLSFDISLGRLQATANRIYPPDGRSEPQALISLEVQRSKPLKIIETLLDLPLSPLQRSIALDAALGGSRAGSLTSSGVGPEALKKHLAVIYRTTGVNSWDQLARHFT